MKFKNTIIIPYVWVYFFLLISIFVIFIVFAINYLVDPFGNRSWIVNKEYKPIVHERSEKYNYIFHQNNIQKYNCLILGSSRVMSIIPDHNQTEEQCYNFGVHVANNPEKLFILEKWLKRSSLKSVYIGNELYNVHSGTRPLYLNPAAFTHGSEGNYLSVSTLLTSIKTIRYAFHHMPQTYFNANGSIHYSQEEEMIRKGFFDHSYLQFQNMAHGYVQSNFVDNQFIYEPKALESLRQIQVLCHRNHVQLYPFITPTFYETQKAMKSNPSLQAASEKFRKDLVNIFGTVYDFDINTSYNSNPINFYDPVHYRPFIGTLIQNRMHNDTSYGKVLKNYE